MRERLLQELLRRLYFGITPARAGKTQFRSSLHFLTRDHPRSCGKDSRLKYNPAAGRRITPARAGKTYASLLSASSQRGSPPLVRERPAIRTCASRSIRITPARAGKTLKGDRVVVMGRDHPRSCGKDAVAVSPVKS